MTKSTLFLAGILMLASGKADRFVRQMAPVVALTHVRVIDGTGGPGNDDQTVIVEGGRITALGAAAAVTIPSGASALDFQGRTVIPGLVGMHNPLFYQLEPSGSTSVIEAPRTFDADGWLAIGESWTGFPKRWLAIEVHTMRKLRSVKSQEESCELPVVLCSGRATAVDHVSQQCNWTSREIA